MPTGQQYATGVPQAQLTAGISGATTSFGVNSLTSWPSTPFTAILDIGTSSQEAIDVLTVSGNNITSCTRGLDGTSAQSHAINATLTHGDIGRDFREARAHIDASSSNDSTGHSVHGLTSGSSVVGTTDSQTLTNKTLNNPNFTGSSAVTMGSGAWSGTGSVQESFLAFSGITGATFQTTRFVGTVSTGAAPLTGTFALGDMIYDTFYQMLWVCTQAGSPGTWRPMGNSATQTVTAAGALNVPAWASTIRLVWNCRSSAAGTGGDFIFARFNADTGSNYAWQTLNAATTTVTGTNSAGTDTSIRIGAIPKAGDTANYYGTGELVVTNAQGSAFKGVASNFTGLFANNNGWSGTGGGIWQSTAAITSITLGAVGGAFAGGSNFTAIFSG